MKNILGMCAVALLSFCVWATSDVARASTVRVTVDGTPWNISTIAGTYVALSTRLLDQPWAGNRDRAGTFAAAVSVSLGTPNSNGARGPLFTIGPAREKGEIDVAVVAVPGFAGADFDLLYTSFQDNSTQSWAVATPVPLPGGLTVMVTALATLIGLRLRRAA